jgi:6-phosphofructokinase 2
LTLNPAVDLACTAPSVRPTSKIRTIEDRLDPGGGGINVARVLHALGQETLALIATGGVTGQLVEELLDEEGVNWRAVTLRGRTRISINVHDAASGLEYRFVPEGPVVAPDEIAALHAILREIDAEWLIASGSLPRGVPADIYADLARHTAERGGNFVLDASGPALRAALGQGIALLKLSLGEFEYLLGTKARSPEQQDAEAMDLIQAGAARMIAVSLGEDGAFLATRDGIIRRRGPAVTVRSAVGAGDAFLAGMVLGLVEAGDTGAALDFGLATGAASVAQYGTAPVSRAQVDALLVPEAH